LPLGHSDDLDPRRCLRERQIRVAITTSKNPITGDGIGHRAFRGQIGWCTGRCGEGQMAHNRAVHRHQHDAAGGGHADSIIGDSAQIGHREFGALIDR